MDSLRSEHSTNLSIPLPSDSTEEDTDPEVEETDEESEQFIQTFITRPFVGTSIK